MKKILSLLFFCFSLSAQEIQRFEPAVWWTGMHNPELQVMVYGKDISETRPSLKYPGVKLLKVHKAESPNYLFLDLKIEKPAKAGDVKIDFTSAGGKTVSHVLKLENRTARSADRKGFDNSDVIYLITPDRFANGDVSNDNTPDTKERLNRAHYNGRHGGDLAGISAQLAYLKNMGFTTLWSMPLLENDLAQVTYHGYSITDYYRIDPRYGSNESFKSLVRQSNALGLKWIMDVVPNHCGIDHWWMADLPFRDWVNNDGKFRSTNHRREVHQDIHASEKDKEGMTGGWFVPSMPDLNQRNPFMARYLTQNTIWWIEYADLGGLRVDTYSYCDKEGIAEWTAAIMKEYPDFNIVGEVWMHDQAQIAYWQKTARSELYKITIPICLR
ncbi:MAG: cyclomaltodextrinase N-terminal domain-containing protein [Leadbetterella sp.]|nr:cyclomaltodextrinase N-terminal domain-containing protein [Leadbetterella sp.]